MRTATLAALALIGGLAACDSPEASRARGTGPGGDVGNRGRIELHAGSGMYHGTPVVVSAPKGTTAAAK